MTDPIDFAALASGVVAYLQTPGAVALFAILLFAWALARVAEASTSRKDDDRER